MERIRSALKFSAAFFLTLVFVLNNANADNATDYGIGRVRSCSITGAVGGLDWNPTTGGKDIDFVLTNPVCQVLIVSMYSTVKLSVAGMNYACASGSSVPRVKPSFVEDVRDTVKAAKNCNAANPVCCGTVVNATLAIGTAIAELSTVYGVASEVYNNASICGSNWTKPDPANHTIGAANHKKEVEDEVKRYIANVNLQSNLNLSDKTYREWYYGGVEVEDSTTTDGNDVCKDPIIPMTTTAGADGKRNGDYARQKYYMKGTDGGNFNCKRYLVFNGQNDPSTGNPVTVKRAADFKDAYNCCKSRSSSYICIDYHQQQKFCKAGDKCPIWQPGNNAFTALPKFMDNQRLICAETYSLCPYNFSIGGGSDYCDYYKDGIWDDSIGRWRMITQAQIEAGLCSANSEIRNQDCSFNNKAGKCRNYCQYMTHCAKVADADYLYESSLSSPYFSDACINFIGDSKNRIPYGTGFLLGNLRNFSAPIAQCMKETLENVFYNRAGHSKCLNLNEVPSPSGICDSGQYAGDGAFVFKKGNQVGDKSFFANVQNNLQSAVKMALTLAIVFYGMKILIGGSGFPAKKEMMPWIIKVSMVLYFATGDAWQTTFFNGVYGASAEFANMVFKIEVPSDPKQRDGCQFGKLMLPDGTIDSANSTDYPPGKSYLAIWDTLDCKLARYLGFGPEASAANIARLIFAGMLTGPIGAYFAISTMFFGLFLLAMIIRALHIFLSSCISIILLVFVSPVVIPTALFARTQSIYKNWLTQLIGLSLQPMILFAYIAIVVMVFDKVLIGSATFYGPGPYKAMSCDGICKDPVTGMIITTTTVNGASSVVNSEASCTQGNSATVKYQWTDPTQDSLACIIGFDQFGKIPIFELFGIDLPQLKLIFTKQGILTILRAVLIIYLLYMFMDEIPGIATSLVGGAALPGSKASPAAMFKQAAGLLAAVQKRGARGTKKLLGKGFDAAKGEIQRRGAGEKSGDEAKDKKSPTVAGKSGSGGGQAGSSGQNNSSAGGGGGSGSKAE